MATERTLILVKPDGVQRGIVGEVLARFERRGLQLIGLKMLRMDDALANQHYAAHAGKGFFPGLKAFMTSSPLVAAAFEGPGAVQAARAAMGATNPLDAATGTIRGDFAIDLGRNVVHGSDSPEAGQREVALFFQPRELWTWQRDVQRWLVE